MAASLCETRVFYVDPHSWMILISENYSDPDTLWRVGVNYAYYEDEIQAVLPALQVFHDLNARQYVVQGLPLKGDQSRILSR